MAGAALFALFAARLLAQVLGIPFLVVLGGLLWCQEISAAAYYMNTTALSMWLTFAALWLAFRPANWRTCTGMVVCIAVAGWIRIDCLLPGDSGLGFRERTVAESRLRTQGREPQKTRRLQPTAAG